MKSRWWLIRIASILLCLLADVTEAWAAAPWRSRAEHAGVLYFFLPDRLERFNFPTREWLPTIRFPSARGNLTAATADQDGLFVAYGKSLYRYALDGSNEIHLQNFGDTVSGVFVDKDILFVNHSAGLYARIASISKTTNDLVDKIESYVDSVYGASIAFGQNKIFGRSQGISPADITYVSYNADGTFTGGGDSPHHGDYPDAERTWVFPDQSRVIDNSGTIYNTENLEYLASLGTEIADIAFYGSDIPIILKGAKVTAFTNTLLPTGSADFSIKPQGIAVYRSVIFGFSEDFTEGSGIRVQTMSVSKLKAPTPDAPMDPNGLPFKPHECFLDENGILYLFSKAHKSIFKWDTKTQRYIDAIGLVGVPDYVAYSKLTRSIFVAYSKGSITAIRLASDKLTEEPFAILPTAPGGLTTVGNYVFTHDFSGAWGTHRVFDDAGVQMDAEDWNYYSSEFIWSPLRQKMYFFRDDTSPNDLLAEEINASGKIGETQDSPLHDSEGFEHPIIMSSDETKILLGSGYVHSALSLNRLNDSIPISFVDAIWRPNGVTTIRTIAGQTEFQLWRGDQFTPGKPVQFPGSALRVLTLNDREFVSISMSDQGIPILNILNNDFRIVAPDVLVPPVRLSLTAHSAYSVGLSWLDGPGERGYVVERRLNGNDWMQIGKTEANVSAFTDSGLSAGNTYTYRVCSINGDLRSEPSEELHVDHKTPSRPGSFEAEAISASTIQLRWTDVANETGYAIERRVVEGARWSVIANVDQGTSSYRVNSLSDNTNYRFRLVAINSVGVSRGIRTDPVKTFLLPPAQPSFQSVQTDGVGPSATLFWKDVNGEVEYVIERREAGGDWEEVVNLGQDTTTYTDLGVENTQAYRYRLIASNSAGRSQPSKELAVEIPSFPKPGPLEELQASTLSSKEIELEWQGSVNASHYRIYRWADSQDPVHVGTTRATHFRDTSVAAGVLYRYRVDAVNESGVRRSETVTGLAVDYVQSLKEEFQPSPNGKAWVSINGGLALNGGKGFGGDNALWFGKSGFRAATLAPQDFSFGGQVSFTWRAGDAKGDGDSYWDTSEENEWVAVEYSLDGLKWTELGKLLTSRARYREWTRRKIDLPKEAWSTNTRLRWRQIAHSGANFDSWALDSLRIFVGRP